MGPIWIFSPIQSSTPGPRASLKIALAHEFFFELPALAFIKQITVGAAARGRRKGSVIYNGFLGEVAIVLVCDVVQADLYILTSMGHACHTSK